MKLSRKLKHLFTATRFPYALVAGIAIVGFGFEAFNLQSENQVANRTLRHWHIENVAKVNQNRQKIFKYRTQLNAMSDEKNAYLNRALVASLLKQEQIGNGLSAKHTKTPRLMSDPKYMKMNEGMMRQTDYDDGRIDSLTHDIHAEQRAIRYDHNHDASTNAEHPQKAKIFTDMAYNGGGAAIILIIALMYIFKTADFNNIQYRKHQNAKEEAQRRLREQERRRREREFGDDEDE